MYVEVCLWYSSQTCIEREVFVRNKFSQTLTHSWCSLFLSPVFKQGMYLGEIKEGRKKRDPGNEVDGNADSDI